MDDEKKLNIFKAKINEVAYPINEEYVDDSKNILNELLEGFQDLRPDSVEESSEDEDEESSEDEDEETSEDEEITFIDV